LDIDLKTIRELLAVVSNTDITELTIESGEQRITVRKAAGVPVAIHVPNAVEAIAPATAPARVAVTVPEAKAEAPKAKEAPASDNGASNGYVQITSPMVGTFYRAASPTAAAFVNVGDRVNVGQTVCIIEAMKLMNDMPSEVAGKIVKVLVENGTTVEYGQALFMVDPKG
jgi:acetyl-CoA carboxylase biotin carboxyl carrier protein